MELTAKEMNELSKYARSTEGKLEGLMENIYKAAQDGLNNVLKDFLYEEEIITKLNSLGYSITYLTNNGRKIGTYVSWGNV